MCDIKEGFKLCTCSTAINRAEPHWKLYRFGQEYENFMVMGSFRFRLKEQNIHWLIHTELNNKNCFDFDYQPQNQDVLICVVDKHAFYFVFDGKDQCWNSDFCGESNWNAKHASRLAKGCFK